MPRIKYRRRSPPHALAGWVADIRRAQARERARKALLKVKQLNSKAAARDRSYVSDGDMKGSW